MPRINLKQLQTRTASALVLGSITLLIIWFGGMPFAGFVLLGACITFYEWRGLASKMPEPLLMSIVGLVYVIIAGAAFYLLRVEFSFALTMFFMVLVWSSDIGAYFAGKFIGGPKMAESISPNKTWAGFGGATIAPGVLCVLGAWLFAFGANLEWSTQGLVLGAFIVGVLVGVIGQGGDLLISMLKRKAGVKDTGSLIPGHGGLLDRIDSMLPNTAFFLLVAFAVKYAV